MRVLGTLQHHLVERRQAGPFLVLLVQGDERRRRTGIGGIGRQDTLVGTEGAIGLSELVFVDPRRPVGQLDLGRLGSRVRSAALLKTSARPSKSFCEA